jgi:hypothetical protein
MMCLPGQHPKGGASPRRWPARGGAGSSKCARDAPPPAPPPAILGRVRASARPRRPRRSAPPAPMTGWRARPAATGWTRRRDASARRSAPAHRPPQASGRRPASRCRPGGRVGVGRGDVGGGERQLLTHPGAGARIHACEARLSSLTPGGAQGSAAPAPCKPVKTLKPLTWGCRCGARTHVHAECMSAAGTAHTPHVRGVYTM